MHFCFFCMVVCKLPLLTELRLLGSQQRWSEFLICKFYLGRHITESGSEYYSADLTFEMDSSFFSENAHQSDYPHRVLSITSWWINLANRGTIVFFILNQENVSTWTWKVGKVLYNVVSWFSKNMKTHDRLANQRCQEIQETLVTKSADQLISFAVLGLQWKSICTSTLCHTFEVIHE